jgi:S-disulfanyl-L-cysteine oxidoreductase SoxD
MRIEASLVPAVLLFLVTGCKVSTPTPLEKRLIYDTKRNITIGDKTVRNPLPLTASSLSSGREAFGHYCVACHGLDGQNTGVPFATRMDPPVPSLASPEVQEYTDGQLKWIIDNGIAPSGMPASKGMLNDDEIWAIVHFVRHLPATGSLGEPEIYGH